MDENYDSCVKKKRIYKKCEHGRRKNICKDCGGSEMCEHNRRRNTCKECCSSSFCEHDRIRSTCKECGGSQICEHNRRRSKCKECCGSSICEHNRERSKCKECDGSSFCEHDRIRSRCKECDGSSICEHNRRRNECKECHGSGICEHNQRRSRCRDCEGSALCKSCKDVYGNSKYDGYCLRCFIYLFPDTPVCRNYKTKETAVKDFVVENFSNVTWKTDKAVQDGCSRKRPDLLLDLGYQVIIIEVDEHKHDSYECSCENKRIMELSQDVDHRPIVLIRFNPDNYVNNDGERIGSCWGTLKIGILTVVNEKKKEWKKRLECLQNQIEYWIDPVNKTEKTIETIQLYYDDFNNNFD